ncbi:MAG: 3'(2'),5'-bisphosphate nucleotidase [Planctomycetota bacterium]
MTCEIQPLVDLAIQAGRLAAAICRKVQTQETVSGVPLSKAGNEPVTVADYASQAVILRAISQAFPEHHVVSEEDSAHLRQQKDDAVGRRVHELVCEVLDETVSFDQICSWIDHQGNPDSPLRWAIDPIDGTKGFIRRQQYAVAIGLLEQGEPAAGVLVCPNLEVDAQAPEGQKGVIMAARTGAGAVQIPLDGGETSHIHVNAATDPKHVRVLGSVESSHGDPWLLTELVSTLGFGDVVRVDSQVKYAVLARGGAEIYLRPRSEPGWREKIWDHAAGMLVAKEAGAITTDMDGKPLDFSCGAKLERNRGVLTTHGPLHEQVVEALAQIEAVRDRS